MKKKPARWPFSIRASFIHSSLGIQDFEFPLIGTSNVVHSKLIRMTRCVWCRRQYARSPVVGSATWVATSELRIDGRHRVLRHAPSPTRLHVGGWRNDQRNGQSRRRVIVLRVPRHTSCVTSRQAIYTTIGVGVFGVGYCGYEARREQADSQSIHGTNPLVICFRRVGCAHQFYVRCGGHRPLS